MIERARTVLDAWFGAGDGPLDPRGPVVRRWFSRDDAFDEVLRSTFSDDLQLAARGELGSWCATPRGALAFVILCDQFSRNIHRGTAQSFALDPLALHTTLGQLARAAQASLLGYERVFLLMPLMHSESLAMHDIAIREFDATAEWSTSNAPEWADYARSSAGYERKHRVIIERFGRYPHRNAALGRTSTDEERAFLSEPGSSF